MSPFEYAVIYPVMPHYDPLMMQYENWSNQAAQLQGLGMLLPNSRQKCVYCGRAHAAESLKKCESCGAPPK